jgi:hypothetical protein
VNSWRFALHALSIDANDDVLFGVFAGMSLRCFTSLNMTMSFSGGLGNSAFFDVMLTGGKHLID